MIKVVSLFDPIKDDPDIVYVNTTSRSDNWSKELSPFFLGPCDLYYGQTAKNVENAWQYSKVYPCHIDENGDPTEDYFRWAHKGWKKEYASRYPMGKGIIPKYTYWDGNKLDYIAARKTVYAPLYSKSVVKTEAFSKLQALMKEGKHIYLQDFDAYSHETHGMTLTDVLNNPEKTMGHAFVIMMLLNKDKAISEFKL